MRTTALLVLCMLLSWLGSNARLAVADPNIDFNRDIRPILSEHCFQCHGPDANQRKSELRLDTQEGALGERDGGPVVQPGKPAASELYARVTSADPDLRMPPPDFATALSKEQIETLRRWIAGGAAWSEHWAFTAPRRPAPANTKRTDWARSALDTFILARLEQEGLSPSPQANRVTLIRRLCLDLIGLPPTPEQVDRFVSDASPDAYERLVDRLLASPSFGERMAVRWLNAARYADTSGYQNDGPRDMWRWRDWVLDAINQNKPFDEFTIEQIAGDLLPNPTLSQQIATGFNRNHRGNAEGGIIPEEYAVEYVVDRVDTTLTVWMGLTIGCARCHDHKYDPIKQQEFYSIFAYFNNVPEHGRAIKEGNSPPYIKAPTEAQQIERRRLNNQLRTSLMTLKDQQRRIATEQAKWERSLQDNGETDYTILQDLVADYGFDQKARDNNSPAGAEGAQDSRPKFVDGDASFVDGVQGEALELDGKRFVDAGDVAKFSYFDKLTLAAWIYPRGDHGGVIVSRMIDAPRDKGYYVQLVDGKVQVNLVARWLDDSVRVETKHPIKSDRWSHITVSYDGSRKAKGIQLFVNGEQAELKVNLDFINQTFEVDEPLRIGGGGGSQGRFVGLIDDVRVYRHNLDQQDARALAARGSLNKLAAIPRGERSRPQATKLRRAFLEKFAPQDLRDAFARFRRVRRQRSEFEEAIPTVMVMKERDQPRDAFVLLRGQYDKPGKKVRRGVPSSLPPLPKDASNDRLALARWLVDANNPLTARVTVNRYWQMLFGEGLVRSVEDFGSQGERPSNPQLLDWLASEFVRLDWDVKALLKTIVTSAAYRQSSRVTSELLAKDPDNRLLARGPRIRLSAEVVRDQALFASGLLTRRLGGASARPYQPEGLWKEIATVGDYEQDHGEGLYRRSMYTYWKRTVAPPTMMTFDASNRETCAVRETTTNTPLQALTLMNEVGFVEASRVLAQRAVAEAENTPRSRINRMFRLLLARVPEPRELKILLAGFHAQLAEYQEHPEDARKLLKMGEYPVSDSIKPPELAAYTAVASLLLNLDEVINKQ